MADYIKLPRSSLTDNLWHDGNVARLYIYLLAKGGDRVSFRGMAKDIGMSLQEVRTALGKLQKCGAITRIATQTSTQVATQISLCGIVDKGGYATQTSTQTSTQVATQTETVMKDGFERFRDFFNNAVHDTSIPQITKLTDARKKALRAIFNEYGKETVENVIQKTLASDFLCRSWGRVNFDWIFKKTNFIKILEGNYDNPQIRQPYTPDGRKIDQYSELENAANEILCRSADFFTPSND